MTVNGVKRPFTGYERAVFRRVDAAPQKNAVESNRIDG
jgi:hypothetical protein